MKPIAVIAMSAVLLGATVSAHAQFAKPEDAIKYRKNSLFVMGQHFGRLGAMAQGKVAFDAKAAADKFQAESVKLAAAAKTGKLDDLKAAFGNAASTCKGCHDTFRAK